MMSRNVRAKLVAGCLALTAILRTSPEANAAAAKHVDFSRDILPILSDKCFHCHGPDEQARKAKLRLDTKEGALRVKGGVAVISPGKSSESELVKRILSTDPDEMMPPPDSHRSLTQEQIQLLKSWVDQGASWGQHWAFMAPAKPKPPEVKAKEHVRNGIDAFVLARLEKENLQPAPEAKKESLIRRLSLDLTGLPPTPAEVDAFVSDASPDAYEKLVKRLLDSPRYGERMAADWLDIARYADTHGYQADRYRAMWPYRDWVIKAFNQNLPFDQFITWQLAGDLLPNSTKEQRLATAFNRLHLQNEEGGIVEEEYRVAYVVDRVNTMGTAFMAMTFECSRCHDHKYDPISQKDFYSLFAFFQNIDESGQTTYFTDAMPVPTMMLTDDGTDAKLLKLRLNISEKEKQVPSLRNQASAAFDQWLATRSGSPALPNLMGSFAFDDISSNKVANSVSNSKPGNAQEDPQLKPGRAGKAAALNGENGFTFPGLGHFTRTDSFSLSIWVQTPAHAPRAVIVHHSKAPIDAGSRGYELLLENGKVAFGLHHMWPGNSLKVETRDAIATNQWVHLTATYDGSSRADGVRIYVNGKPADLTVIRDGLYKDITYESGGEPELTIGYRFRDAGFKDGLVDDFQIFNRAVTPIEAAHLAGHSDLSDAWRAAPESLGSKQRADLLDYYVATSYLPGKRLVDELRLLRQEESKLVNSVVEVMTMQEMPTPKPAFVLKRGAYDAPGERVSADTPAVMPRFPNDQPRNRLGFARWLTSPEHPLTARVTVNRAWQMMFGKGIVETSDNFGTQGAFPTHPELLDWLANEFVKSGWDMKELLRLIALSSTYRQSSTASPELLARDPGNDLLARGPAKRLSAEMLRDQALAVSSLLAEKLGGPSVKPYQPEGLWEEKAMGKPRYDQGKGEDLHRRSLYTYWKRTVPHPAMIVFDAAERNVCVVKRQATSTPLQALALLNDTQIVEAARHIGQRMLQEGGSNLGDKVSWAFQLVTGRRPSARETEILKSLFNEQRELFSAEPLSATKLLSVGDAANDPRFDLADLAAGTVLAQAILNHDAAVMAR